ncbi:uncharacterized protein LOC5505101 isoform X1 [Nematostella vectensis]|uniref:uncharacterized protein LOC5505101 isoform X1 n=1 Tax=Nematostella vectensis TaxID=45351 RepID=UPI00138FC04E|nr:uncharacterized protein LOC5505101 isoform X1 [Nematostella vectensis]
MKLSSRGSILSSVERGMSVKDLGWVVVVLMSAGMTLSQVPTIMILPTLRDDPINTKFACEYGVATILCDDNRLIEITEIFYGRKKDHGAICVKSVDSEIMDCKMDSQKTKNRLAKMRRDCDGKPACASIVSGDFGDPGDCPGVSKYLRVIYYCVKPPTTPTPTQLSTEVPEVQGGEASGVSGPRTLCPDGYVEGIEPKECILAPLPPKKCNRTKEEGGVVFYKRKSGGQGTTVSMAIVTMVMIAMAMFV